MKVSPVVGTPTIPNLSHTGLSAEKLATIKAIAANQPPPEAIPEEEKPIQLGQPTTSATRRIVMSTNRTVDRNGGIPQTQPEEEPLPIAAEAQTEPSIGVSDTNVQAQSNPIASRPISPELAQLARDRQALRLEREEFAKEKALQGQIPEGYFKVEDLKANALSVLQKAGVTYDQLTQEILGAQGQSPQPDLTKFQEDLLKKVEEKLAGKDTAQEEAVYGFMKKEVDRLSFSSNDYKLIRESKSQDDVMDLVKRMWRDKGEILDEKEAMDLIEAELREDARRYAKLIGELEPTKAPVEKPPVQATAQRGQIKTLTNKDSARPVMTRRQRAIAAALGQKP